MEHLHNRMGTAATEKRQVCTVTQTLCRAKELTHKRLHAAWFHLYGILGQAKLIYSENHNCCLVMGDGDISGVIETFSNLVQLRVTRVYLFVKINGYSVVHFDTCKFCFEKNHKNNQRVGGSGGSRVDGGEDDNRMAECS